MHVHRHTYACMDVNIIDFESVRISVKWNKKYFEYCRKNILIDTF